jgi:glycosyltransferase involved in cell wall biosynthesis
MGGPRELVSNGVDGYITKWLDVQDFAAAVECLLNNAPLRESMSHNALTRVENRDWQEAFTRFWAMSPE